MNYRTWDVDLRRTLTYVTLPLSLLALAPFLMGDFAVLIVAASIVFYLSSKIFRLFARLFGRSRTTDAPEQPVTSP
ncbi:hypothetical protein ABZ942_07920 [Nocardia sp. NPDC046473]|uniref:hypothetical protein n=1 Tax=Nocardia sp. NPDC046473 TaxID=3155733 RepID=UPI0034072561